MRRHEHVPGSRGDLTPGTRARGALAPSRYNFAVLSGDGRIALFNTRTGSLLELGGAHASDLTDALTDTAVSFTGTELPNELLAKLVRGGHLVPVGFDELGAIRESYWRARDCTPVVVTITTTMDCNLGCYYCYEERSAERLTTPDVVAIVELARRRVEASVTRALHVDWYGGEPLLNLTFIEEASAALQADCAARGVSYVASIISNGSAWPDDVEDFVSRHRIRQVQISFDGLRANHDKRRRYRKGFGGPGVSSFDRAVTLVDRLVRCTRVDIRYNIDRGNSGDLLPFIRFARQRGWFDAVYRAVFQPARVASYSAASAFMRARELPLEEFDRLRAMVRAELGPEAPPEESEVPDGFPHPKTSVCAALAANSVVVGADRLTYRCGLQVGERSRAVGSLSGHEAPERRPGSDASWWAAFDPTERPPCSACSFLPICWGGCPKRHLEDDGHALAEQGRYWRTNLPRLIAKAAGFTTVEQDVIPERLQFR